MSLLAFSLFVWYLVAVVVGVFAYVLVITLRALLRGRKTEDAPPHAEGRGR